MKRSDVEIIACELAKAIIEREELFYKLEWRDEQINELQDKLIKIRDVLYDSKSSSRLSKADKAVIDSIYGQHN